MNIEQGILNFEGGRKKEAGLFLCGQIRNRDPFFAVDFDGLDFAFADLVADVLAGAANGSGGGGLWDDVGWEGF